MAKVVHRIWGGNGNLNLEWYLVGIFNFEKCVSFLINFHRDPLSSSQHSVALFPILKFHQKGFRKVHSNLKAPLLYLKYQERIKIHHKAYKTYCLVLTILWHATRNSNSLSFRILIPVSWTKEFPNDVFD